jgi:hypothetical protein
MRAVKLVAMSHKMCGRQVQETTLNHTVSYLYFYAPRPIHLKWISGVGHVRR